MKETVRCEQVLIVIVTLQHYYRPLRSCGKVMFSHLSVSHSVHKGMSAPVHVGIHPPGQTTPPLPVHAGIHMVAAADGTHPTGMHSYTINDFSTNKNAFQ